MKKRSHTIIPELFLASFALLSILTAVAQVPEKPKYAPRGDGHQNMRDELGRKQGLWKYFNYDREIIAEVEYVNDKKQGMSKRYYVYEKIMEECTYTDGKKDGDYKKYFFSGQLQVEGSYYMGKRDGQWTYYFEDEETKMAGAYVKGRKEGEWKTWDKKGNLLSTVTYKDGVDVKMAAAMAEKKAAEKKAAEKQAAEKAAEQKRAAEKNKMLQKADSLKKK